MFKDKLYGPVTKWLTGQAISDIINNNVQSPAGRRIIMSGIKGATGGAVVGATGGAVLGASATGPLAGIGAVPGAFVGGLLGAETGLANGLLTQTIIEIFGIPDKIDEIVDKIRDMVKPCK